MKWSKRLRGSGAERFACAAALWLAALPAFAEPCAPCLAESLASSNGAVDHHQVVAALDQLRSMGPSATPAAETLSALLSYRSPLYAGRDKAVAVRLRAYVLLTLSEIGFPASARPALLDALAHLDERMGAFEVGAAIHAVNALGARGRELSPYLLEAMSLRMSDEEFSLARYTPQFGPEESTTVRLEAVRTLGRVCVARDQLVVSTLRKLSQDERGRIDPRVVREARRAVALIEERP
jgi:hypothetical protein